MANMIRTEKIRAPFIGKHFTTTYNTTVEANVSCCFFKAIYSIMYQLYNHVYKEGVKQFSLFVFLGDENPAPVSLRYNAQKIINSYYFKTRISFHLRGTRYQGGKAKIHGEGY